MFTSLSRAFWCTVFAVFFVAVSAPAAHAQDTGAMAGVVVDSETGDPMPGTNVAVVGTSTGTSTDLNGRYKLTGLAPGQYDLVFSFIGYQQKTVTGVEVNAGETTTLDIALSSETKQLEQVTVTAAVAQNTEAGLLRERQKSAAMSNAISAEAIGQTGAGSAADAMKKVTGASVVGGKYVVVRGLGGRYSNTQLNGVDLPSSDPETNSVQFDLFPAGMLKNVTTIKTFTPDRPGNFSGGLVNIATKDFPTELNVKFSTSVKVNPQVHFTDDFVKYPGGSLDWLGYGSGDRAMPGVLAGLAPNQIPDGPAFVNGSGEAAQYDAISKAFNNTMGPSAGYAPVDMGYSFTAGNQLGLFGRDLGYVFSLSYDRSSSYYDAGRTGRYTIVSRSGEKALDDIIALDDEQGTSEATVGALANVSYKVTSNHEFGVNLFYTNTGTSTTRFQRGTWTEIGAQDQLVNRTLLYNERSVFSTQVRGKSYFPSLNDALIEWQAARAKTTQEDPDRRFFASVDRAGPGGHEAFNQGLREPSRIFRNMDETKYSAQLDVAVPFTLLTRKSEIKAGGAYSTSDRFFGERGFSFNRPDPQANLQFNGDAASYFSDPNQGLVGTDANGNPIWGLTINDQTSPFSDYTGDRTIQAGYAMVDLQLTDALRFIGGARLETTEITVQATPDSIGQIDTEDILPSLNLVYALREDMNLRAAATRTLARPTFREIAPYPSFSFIQGEIRIGNPSLRRTLITNLDLRWEWFRRPGEVLAFSVYYKDMDQPIEKAFIGSSSNTGSQLTWKNVEQAEVYGAEVEARTRLDYIHAALDHFTFGANASFTESQISVPCLEFAPNGTTCLRGELAFRQANNQPGTRDLQGQSPFLVNLDLSYDNPQTGTSGGLFFNIFGERLAVVSAGTTPDVYEQPRPQLDFTFSQRLLDSWSVSFEASNLLNSAYEQTYSFNNRSVVYQRYQAGRSFSLGFTYEPY